MKCQVSKSLAVAIVLVEIASLGVAATSASAQTTPPKRRITRQEQIIARQQRQIEEYQRQLAAQQQVGQADTGLFGVLGCPRGYTYSWFGDGCYPNVPVPVTITPR